VNTKIDLRKNSKEQDFDSPAETRISG